MSNDDAAAAGQLLELELRCCCCGTTMGLLETPWLWRDVQPQSLWTRTPCRACIRELKEPRMEDGG